MSDSVQKPSSSEVPTSDYVSPIKIFGQAKSEIGDIFSELNGYIGDSISMLSGLFYCLTRLCNCLSFILVEYLNCHQQIIKYRYTFIYPHMSPVNQRHIVAETRQSVYVHCRQC